MGRRKNALEEAAPNVASPIGEFVEEYVVKPSFDADGIQASSGIGVDGREYPDPVPMSAPVGAEAPIPLMDLMRMMVHRAVAPQNDFDIDETEEEANDFDTDDERPDPMTPYEAVFYPPPPPPAAPSVSSAAPAAAGGSPVNPPAAASAPAPGVLNLLDSSGVGDTKPKGS